MSRGFTAADSPTLVCYDRPMRIAIVGAGAVGGLLCGLVARAGKEEVVLVARGEAGRAIAAEGLAATSPLGTFTARPALVVEDPAAGRPVRRRARGGEELAGG
jgi:hypothetical protein